MAVQFNKVLRLLIILLLPYIAHAGDWPMWRYDAGRSASSTEELADQLYLQWTKHYTPREQVWDDPLNNDLMQFDKIFEPIAAGELLYIGFNDQDKVVALESESGREVWTFYADGPVRLPMVYNKDKIYFTSDDGYLYCISAAKGQLVWKFRGGPADRKMLGNKRLISTWPARGGVVIDHDTAYFAASIWPSMGTFIYAVNAETGDLIWKNDGTSADYIKQPHSAYAFAGIAPQGTMALDGDHLLVPGGRSVPGCFNKNTGEEEYYFINKYNKSGGSFIGARNGWFVNHYRNRNVIMYKVDNGERVSKVLEKYPVLGEKLFYFSGPSVVARDPEKPGEIVWKLDVDASGDLIQAGGRLYAGGKNSLTAIQLDENGPSIAWKQEVEGTIGRLIAANGRLFAVTMDGNILTFGPDKPNEVVDIESLPKPVKISKSVRQQVDKIIDETKATAGYALYFGEKDYELLAALAQMTNLSVIAVTGSSAKVYEWRRKFDEMGFKADKVAFLEGTPQSIDFAPYFSSLTIVENIADYPGDAAKLLIKKIHQSTRPFGGKIWIYGSGKILDGFSTHMQTASLDGMKIISSDQDRILLSREGAPEGSANWTHLYGDNSNTIKSDDELVKLPLGVLWFGGISNMEVLPRHGHGPPEQIIDGKLIIQGLNNITARDVYTGRPLWKMEFETLGTYGMYYNESYSDDPLTPVYNQEHLPGVNTRGTNFVVTHDLVYVVQGYSCHVIDIETGEKLRTIRIPEHERNQWGYIGVSGDNLIAGAEFVKYGAIVKQSLKSTEEIQTYIEVIEAANKRTGGFREYGYSASQSLVVADRHTNKGKWSARSKYGFIHNAITSSDNTLFAIDKIPVAMINVLARRGIDIEGDFTLTAFNIDSGDTIWQTNSDVFGSWLSYSKKYDILLQATRPSRDMIKGENGERMIVHRASDGKVLWDKKINYYNPPILHGKKIIVDDAAYDLMTGEVIKRTNPVTGEEVKWAYTRTYGCNYIISSENLLSFRSGAAGFYDLKNFGGTGNLGGFKSGCTSNMIAANGVLNAPDYTRTCSCSYQNQTSLAFVHMPRLEYWTNNEMEWSGKRVKQVGINFGAPGDRMSENNTLWLDYPSVGGKSPDIPVELSFVSEDTTLVKLHKTISENAHDKKIGYIRTNSFDIDADDHAYVVASALSGGREIVLTLEKGAGEEVTYKVKLYFAELEPAKASSRTFNVNVQGEEVLKDFNIAKAAGGVDKLYTREIDGVLVEDKLIIKLSPAGSDVLPLLSGVEIIAE